jgi:tRNA-2-methylthio-N6-dimethylallyladenosine synthase
MNKKYFIKTMGCQMNVHDSEKIAGIFSESGLQQTDEPKDAGVVVLNTCSIREKAEHKFYSELGRLKSLKINNPDLTIAVAGCIAQQKGNKLFKQFPYVDFIFGPNNIDSLQQWIRTSNVERRTSSDEQRTMLDVRRTTALHENPDYLHKLLPVKRVGKVRAWVSIMYGCNNFCAYCVVPYTRGCERSRPLDDIYNEISLVAAQGFREVTLLGQNVNSYGKNLANSINFPTLLEKLHEIGGIDRIRFVTSHPKDLSERLINAMKDLPKLCEHLHLPIQSGSDKILNLMNRVYTYADYKEKIEMLRSAIPDIAVTTDIITGFPGETEEDFEMTIKALSEIEYDGIFAFKFSKRPDTKALDLPDHIDEPTKSGRLSRILELQESITFLKNKALEGKVVDTLVEGVSETDDTKLTGRSRTNKIVNYCGDKKDIGQFVNIKISRAQQHSLYGKRVQGN